MKLALRELRRRPGRFAVAGVILTLIGILLMFLGGLLDGLVAGSTGALRAQRGELMVFSSTSQESLTRSRITPEVRTAVENEVGKDHVAGLANVQLGARLDGRDPRDLVAVVLFGYERAPTGLPDTAPEPGKVYADESLRGEGISEGTVLRLGPARSEVTVVGFLADSQYSGQGSLWGSLDTWRQVLGDNRPGERVGPGVVQALVIHGVAPAPESIDGVTDGATSTLTIEGAIDALPGVAQQKSVFNQILGVTVMIAIVVVALFFALITVERTGLYGVLKAMGAKSRTLFLGVVVQAMVVTLVASAIGAAASLALAAAIPAGSIPFLATPARLLNSVAYLVFAALLGCAFSLRRVLRVDPASAIGGEQ